MGGITFTESGKIAIPTVESRIIVPE